VVDTEGHFVVERLSGGQAWASDVVARMNEEVR
jgi:hypothetical protein